MWLVCCVIFLLVIYIFCRSTVRKTSPTCLLGKTALVTGANSGIGYEIALNLASRGCRVIMADVADMEKSKTEIMTLSNNPNIISKKLDLSSLKSVRNFAQEIKKSEAKLDILINNAAIFASEENRTSDGLHPVVQVNYLGHFLLTHLLIDLLKKAAPSRIVFTTSLKVWFNNLKLENLNVDDTSQNWFSKLMIYTNSKFAILIASDIFASKLKGTGVTCNSVNPGEVYSKLSQDATKIFYYQLLTVPLHLFIRNFFNTPWEGAQGAINVATAKELEMTTGKHFWKYTDFYKPLSAYNKVFCESIWDASEKLVNLSSDEMMF